MHAVLGFGCILRCISILNTNILKSEVHSSVRRYTMLNVIFVRVCTTLMILRVIFANEMDPYFVARKWAPEIRLARDEQWFPSSVDYFLKHVYLSGSEGTNLTTFNLPSCTNDCFLTTKEELHCSTCTNIHVLSGQTVSSVPAYAIFDTYDSYLTIEYLFFYPYNRGKSVCIGIYQSKGFWFLPAAGCVGGYASFGHHVGDWEDVKITLKSNGSVYEPLSLEISAHGYSKEYFWNSGNFQKDNDILSLYNRTHPIIYAAKGSHGHWSSAGEHRYENLPNGHYLMDECSDGTRWKTWRKLKVVRKHNYVGEFNFLNFRGHWGNRKRGCGIVESLSMQCVLNDGPFTIS